MTKEALKLALEALEYIYEGANNQGPHTGISWRCVAVKAEPAITALREALVEQPAQGCNYCNHALYSGTKCKNCGRVTEQAAIKRDLTPERPAKQDIPDLIAGTLGVSRGTAYDLMREALAQERSSDEQPAQQEPVAWCVLEPWLSGKFEAQDCFSDVALDANVGWVPLYTTPPAAQPAPVQESEKRECMNCAAFGECNPNNDAGRCGYEPPAAQRQWVGLTDEDIEQEFGFIDELLRDCVHRTEAKVREKNL